MDFTHILLTFINISPHICYLYISEECFKGSLEYIDKLLNWAHEYGMSVLIDIHAMKGSQNGFDNSGQTLGFQWTSALTAQFGGLTTFEHWPIRSAEWMGKLNPANVSYDTINRDNIQHSLDVIAEIVDRYSGHPAVLGLEPVNEPWQYTPIEELKRFYWEGYLIVKRKAPYWKYVMHDSFRFDPNIWGGFMKGCVQFNTFIVVYPLRILYSSVIQSFVTTAYSRASLLLHSVLFIYSPTDTYLLISFSLSPHTCTHPPT